MIERATPHRRGRRQVAIRLLLTLAAVAVGAVMVWEAVRSAGDPDPLRSGAVGSAVLDVGVLVFREGLESILVLAAITASMVGTSRRFRRPVAWGAASGLVATLLTWEGAIRVVDSLTESFSALQVQAATGLLAIVVLLVVMNWFFHKVYWTGWITVHTKRKQELLRGALDPSASRTRILLGLAVLGFTSIYREGFEVVLFLQDYRLKLGTPTVRDGVLIGVALTGVVAVLTFLANRRLSYRRMLVLTGVLLGVVLLVMVGEQGQEMQLAHWLPTTRITWLAPLIPGWARLWFAVFPTVETLAAQAVAAVLVVGSYSAVRFQLARAARRGGVATG